MVIYDYVIISKLIEVETEKSGSEHEGTYESYSYLDAFHIIGLPLLF